MKNKNHSDMLSEESENDGMPYFIEEQEEKKTVKHKKEQVKSTVVGEEAFIKNCKDYINKNVETWTNTQEGQEWMKDDEIVVDKHFNYFPGLQEVLKDLSPDLYEYSMKKADTLHTEILSQSEFEQSQNSSKYSCYSIENLLYKKKVPKVTEKVHWIYSRRFFQYVYDKDNQIKLMVPSFHHIAVELKQEKQDGNKRNQKRANQYNYLEYFIKTIKIFDIFEKEHKEIFVEAIQIDQMEPAVQQHNYQGFNTSILEKNDHIYFFQRSVKFEKEDGENVERTYLTLVRASVSDLKQNIHQIPEICIKEKKGYYCNTLFSNQLMNNDQLEYENEVQFVRNQFVLVQYYPLDKTQIDQKNIPFKIFSLADMSSPIFVSDSKKQKIIKKENIYQFYHQFSRENHENVIEFFVADNKLSEIHIEIDSKHELYQELKSHRQLTLDQSIVSDKHFQNSSLRKHHIHEGFSDSNFKQPIFKNTVNNMMIITNEQEMTKETFYFIIEENSIELIHPIPKDRELHADVVQQITNKLQIERVHDEKLKTLIYMQNQKTGQVDAVIQETDRLMNLLNLNGDQDEEYQDFMKPQQFQNFNFCYGEDDKRQLLTIIDPNSRDCYIRVMYLKHHSHIMCHQDNILIMNQVNNGPVQNLRNELNKIVFSRDLDDSKFISQQSYNNQQNEGDQENEKSISESNCFSRETFFPSIKSTMYKKETSDKCIFMQNFNLSSKSKFFRAQIKDLKDNQDKTINVFNLQDFQSFFDYKVSESVSLNIAWYQRYSKGYFFILCLTVSNLKQVSHKSYFIKTLNFDQVQNIFNNRDQVLIDFSAIKKNQKFKFIRDDDKLVQNSLIQELEILQFKNIDDENFQPHNLIRLYFPKCPDERYQVDFIAFILIYRKTNGETCRFFTVFDIQNEKFRSEGLMMRQNNQFLMHENEDKFKCFTLCQTSDLKYQNHHKNSCQMNFSIFAFFKKDVGVIKVRDFIVEQNQHKINIKLIGMKHVFFSNDLIKNCNYELLALTSFPVPKYKNQLFYKKDKEKDNLYIVNESSGYSSPNKQLERNFISGCYLILMMSTIKENKTTQGTSQQRAFLIDLDENQQNSEYYNNISEIVHLNDYKIRIQPDNESQYVQVIHTRLKNNLIQSNKLSNTESLFLLERFSQMQIGCRLPDLKYVIQNTFKQLLNRDLFQKQLMLDGQSISDLMLTEYQTVSQAVKRYQERKKQNYLDNDHHQLKMNSQVHYLSENESYRKKMFRQLEFIDEEQIISFDFNLQGTIGNGVKQNASRTIQELVQLILEHENSSNYIMNFMIDFKLIIQSRNLDIQNFFEREHLEALHDREYNICSFEQLLNSLELPGFSDESIKYEFLDNINIFEQERRDQLSQRLRDNHQEIITNDRELKHRVEHFYIDFSMMILKEKIQNITQGKKETYQLTQLELARLLNRKAEMNDIKFFKSKTIQRVIDIQWLRCRKYQLFMLTLYLFYIFQLIEIVIYPNDHIGKVDEIKFCIFARILLILVEFLQLAVNGLEYFTSLSNWLDLLEFVLFMAFCMTLDMWNPNHQLTQKLKHVRSEINLIQICLGFRKLISFIQIFSKFGLVLRMMAVCTMELIPFITWFLLFLLFFSFSMVVLNNQPDDETADVQYIGLVGITILYTFRTSIGELAVPTYDKLLADPSKTPFQKHLNIYMIWVTWYVQVFVQTVIMLTFIIAVINETYEELNDKQKIIHYQTMSNINLECLEIYSFFGIDSKFSVILFSGVSEEENEDNEGKKITDQIKQFVIKQSDSIQSEFWRISEMMSNVQQNQEKMNLVLENNTIQVTKQPAKQIMQPPPVPNKQQKRNEIKSSPGRTSQQNDARIQQIETQMMLIEKNYKLRIETLESKNAELEKTLNLNKLKCDQLQQDQSQKEFDYYQQSPSQVYVPLIQRESRQSFSKNIPIKPTYSSMKKSVDFKNSADEEINKLQERFGTQLTTQIRDKYSHSKNRGQNQISQTPSMRQSALQRTISLKKEPKTPSRWK